MSLAVIGYLDSEIDIAESLRVLAYNYRHSSLFGDRLYGYNFNSLIEDSTLDEFDRRLSLIGYRPLRLPVNKGYQFGFLDLLTKVHGQMTKMYLNVNSSLTGFPSFKSCVQTTLCPQVG